MVPEPTVFVVDDDPAVRASITMLLRGEGLQVEDYEDADAFLDDWSPDRPGCLVVDLRMPRTDGLELQARLCDRGEAPPIIVLTGHADVSAAVRAFRNGAVDFLEKPFDAVQLLSRIREALERDRLRRASDSVRESACRRIAGLTPRERDVLECIAAGSANKAIAVDLGISERTVELHRGRIMKKMGVRSVAELIPLYLAAQDAG